MSDWQAGVITELYARARSPNTITPFGASSDSQRLGWQAKSGRYWFVFCEFYAFYIWGLESYKTKLVLIAYHVMLESNQFPTANSLTFTTYNYVMVAIQIYSRYAEMPYFIFDIRTSNIELYHCVIRSYSLYTLIFWKKKRPRNLNPLVKANEWK